MRHRLDPARARALPSDLLRAADTALYTAKRTGRGRVVVGRAEPAGETRQTGRPGARRARRDGLEVDTGALIIQGLGLLDGPLRAAAPLERLEGLATSLGSSLRAAAAAVSLCAHGGSDIETLFQLDLRSGHSTSVRQGIDGTRYALDDYPRTAELLAGGGSLHLYAGDDDADAAERALLGELGVTDVLLAGAADGRGAWLLEIYGDAASADLSRADGVLRLLCDHAVRPAGGLRADRRSTQRACAPCTNRRPARRPRGTAPEAAVAPRRPRSSCSPAAPAAAVPPQPIPEGPDAGSLPVFSGSPRRSGRSRCRTRRGTRSWRPTGARTCTSTATSPTSTRGRGRWGARCSGARRSSRACARR